MHLPSLRVLAVLSVTALLSACSDEISSDEQARRAYLGLDKSVEKSLQLGFAGFNAASSANIPPQSTTGDAGGTLDITGQVDQGSSANKGMRLRVGMKGYTDGEVTVAEEEAPVEITYQTTTDAAAQPALTLSLRDIPNGTFTGTLVGSFQMTGDIEGEVTLNLSLSGQIEDDGTGKVRRKAGSTTVTGTAKSSTGGEFQVNVTL
ncbi:hypothetical protein D187_003974 [Cystobacter fuscus DSM 2262]|uniref:Lipoprotein n=1 Tax=Cystobacter fuscus (strain ATCC 25194 / DSM 2262 / NBRC 100088 / M29) TaxID=1242864 RepID=S9P8D5_CYSF2|nr:hypothetical protein [Cystobacter fuscus]EPX58502.1 hypothetical protein D187_003974 [Cystobacter fuscus DSM 2262]